MTIHPFLFWLWVYLTIGLVTSIIMEVTETYEHMSRPKQASHRLTDYAIGLFLWPFVVVIGAIALWEYLFKGFKDARRNTAAVKENERLKEELALLKDKLYELEP